MPNTSVLISMLVDSDPIGGVLDLWFGDLSPMDTLLTPDELGNYNRGLIKGFVGNNDRCSLLKCVNSTEVTIVSQ